MKRNLDYGIILLGIVALMGCGESPQELSKRLDNPRVPQDAAPTGKETSWTWDQGFLKDRVVLPVEIDGKVVQLYLDTAVDDSLTLTREGAKKAGLKTMTEDAESSAMEYSNERDTVKVTSVKIGPFDLKKTSVRVWKKYYFPGSDGMINLQDLKAFKLTFQPKDKKVILSLDAASEKDAQALDKKYRNRLVLPTVMDGEASRAILALGSLFPHPDVKSHPNFEELLKAKPPRAVRMETAGGDVYGNFFLPGKLTGAYRGQSLKVGGTEFQGPVYVNHSIGWFLSEWEPILPLGMFGDAEIVVNLPKQEFSIRGPETVEPQPLGGLPFTTDEKSVVTGYLVNPSFKPPVEVGDKILEGLPDSLPKDWESLNLKIQRGNREMTVKVTRVNREF